MHRSMRLPRRSWKPSHGISPAIYYDGIDHFSHAFMAYHPPKLPWIREEDFALYKDVVSRRIPLSRHDAGALARAGRSGNDGYPLFRPWLRIRLAASPRHTARTGRPGGLAPAVWNICDGGAGIKRDERIYGASLIDVAPTVLTLFDLPIGEDMDGRPLLEAFEVPPRVKTIPSWEKVPGECGMQSSGQQMDT